MKKWLGIIGLIIVISGILGLFLGRVNKEDKFLEELDNWIIKGDKEGILEYIDNYEKDINKYQELTMERLREDFNEFLQGEYEVDTYKDIYDKRLELIKEVGDLNLIKEEDKQELENKYREIYKELNNYYLAKKLVMGRGYNDAMILLEGIKENEILEEKAGKYREEVVKLVVQDIKLKADTLDSKEALDYVKKVKDQYNFALDNYIAYQDLISYYQDKVLVYDVSKMSEIDLQKLLDIIKTDKLVVVYIGRETCPACKKLVPVMNGIMDEVNEKIYYVDAGKIDYNSEEFKTLEGMPGTIVKKYPVILAFKNDKVIEGLEGSCSEEVLRSFYKKIGII